MNFKLLAALAHIALLPVAYAQNATDTDVTQSKAADAAARALELVGNKAKGLEDKLEKAAPELLKEVEQAPKILKQVQDTNQKNTSTSGTAKKTTTQTKKEDPSAWSKESVRKLAVMDVEFGGGVQTVMFELLEKDAPRTVDNFIQNCQSKSYENLAIHRAIDGYLVQTGDPLTADDSQRSNWGTGGGNKTIPGEFKVPHSTGCVAMARLGDKVNPSRASNAYQFYFGLGNMASLNGSYTVFGRVVSGLEVLQQISQTPADSNDCPIQRIEVKSIKVIDHKGPLISLRSTGYGAENKGRRYTKPASAKSGWERFIERVW
jgi:cyclophilin family peptidyl-prolyl cis-trans isomerase